MPRADSIRPYNPCGKLIPFIEPLCPETGRGDYWPIPTEADAKASIASSFLFVFYNSPLSFFSFLYSLFPNLKKLQKSTLLL